MKQQNMNGLKQEDGQVKSIELEENRIYFIHNQTEAGSGTEYCPSHLTFISLSQGATKVECLEAVQQFLIALGYTFDIDERIDVCKADE